MRLALVSLALAALLAPAASGQELSPEALETLLDEEIAKAIGIGTTQERLELFNACRPMVLVIEGLSSYAAQIGLTKEVLQAAAESRLRSARLYTENQGRANFAHLYVRVNVAGPAFSSLVAYRKKLTDEFGNTGGASAWEDGSAGTHGKDGGYIVSALSQHLDKFLAGYLRVNEAACGPPEGRP